MTPFNHYFQDKPFLLENLFNTTQDGLLVLDRNLFIVQVNHWMEKKFASDMPLIGKKCHSVLCKHEDDCSECQNIMSLEAAKPFRRVVHFPSDCSPTEWLELNMFRLADSEGKTIGAIGHVKDVTAHKRMEKLLTDEVTWRRILVEQSRDGIVVLDQDGKVYEANRRFAVMLGYTAEEVRQLYVWDWDTRWTKEVLLEKLRTVDHSGDHFETRHRRKDDSLYEVEISTNGAVYHGEKLVFCVCRDISERKRAEQEREKLITELRDASNEIKALRSILPLCSFCKKIRNDKGYWEQVDVYIEKHLQTDVSHGICPECMEKNFPEEYKLIFPEIADE
ncbi:MAG: PAS domain S-box protein [Deltaproteobacteria bacterium]|nr:PAS domain S-box protein [Deltaproteobacteria bacterium]